MRLVDDVNYLLKILNKTCTKRKEYINQLASENDDKKEEIKSGGAGEMVLSVHYSGVNDLSDFQYHAFPIHHLFQFYGLHGYESDPSSFCGAQKLPQGI